MSKSTISFFFSLIIIVLLSGCNQAEKIKYSDITYGVIYSSNLEPKSILKLYSYEWKELKAIPLNVGGIQKSTIQKNKLYAPVLGTTINPSNKILEYDFADGKVNFLDTEPWPVSLKVRGNDLFVLHNSAMNVGTISKLDISSNKTTNSVELVGTIKDIAINENNVFVTTDEVSEEFQYIYVLDFNLKLLDTIKNNKTAFTTDTIVTDQNIIFMNVAKNDFSGPTNQLTMLDVPTNKINTLTLEASSPYQGFELNDKLFITHFHPTENLGNKITVFNKTNMKQKVFTLKNDLFKSVLLNGKFLSLNSHGNIFEYETEYFELVKEYKLKASKDMVITDFFTK